MRFSVTREITAVLRTAFKKAVMFTCIRMIMNGFSSDLVDDRSCYTLHFDTSLINLKLVSRSQCCKKANTSSPIILQSFQLV